MGHLYSLAVVSALLLFTSLSAADCPSIKTRRDAYPADVPTCHLYQDQDCLLQNNLILVDNTTLIESRINMANEHFRKLVEFETDYSPSRITKYESKRTGMTAVVVDKEGPKVNGFFTFATEIFDDSGSPHTLEHLCFMGSKNYPYKGILDRLATRSVGWRGGG